MSNYDPQLAQRVWQRVQGGRQTIDPQPPLFPLLRATLADSVLCTQLAGQHKGPPADLLRQIAREKQSHADCLKGILRLTGEMSGPISPTPPAGKTPQAALRHCLGSTLRCAQQYRAWETHPEYGCVFGLLAHQEVTLAQKLLQFWGGLPEKVSSQ